ncbi:BatA domain-containing protein [Thalassoglobus sp. JC818]|uniref:BatA domain-containing protein n=1 Tax=Thalassoglobus sp. JC818 TaxID=3232136 RepID=UPI0034591592
MSFGFLNILMLTGLAAVALPVLAHLISRRRFEVVEWGAMQFLKLGHRTRRKIRLQDFLLLLIRMLVLGMLALALARPWGSGAIFGSLAPAVSRDVVFVIDGSGSMGWESEDGIPHQRAIQWVFDALEELNPGDTVSLIDARTQTRRLIHPPSTDLKHVRDSLQSIAAPDGTSKLSQAVIEAVQILLTTSNVSREVVVLTDLQKFPWSLDDQLSRQRLDDLMSQPAVPPTISIVDFSEKTGTPNNFSVGEIGLSRSLTVPGFPIQIRSVVSQSGGASTTKSVRLNVNDQPVAGAEREVTLAGNGQSTVDFSHVFSEPGIYRIRIALEHDQLPVDDLAECLIEVVDGVPVLIVDGARHQDETRSESFFVSAAFASSGETERWVRSTVIPPAELNEQALKGNQVVLLCNVSFLDELQQRALTDFVESGGGLLIAPGDRTDSNSWNNWLVSNGDEIPQEHFLPVEFLSIESQMFEAVNDDGVSTEVMIDTDTLTDSWMERFQKGNDVDFSATRFSKWWKLAKPKSGPDAQPDTEPENAEIIESKTEGSVAGRFNNGDPFLVMQQSGEGKVAVLSVPLDADWSTLPARSDFVPFLHELVFQLSGQGFKRNVAAGTVLRLPLEDGERPRDYSVRGPNDVNGEPKLLREGESLFAAYAETSVPGLYEFVPKDVGKPDAIPFLVLRDPAESDLTRIDEVEWEILSGNDRMKLIDSMSDLTAASQAELTRSELWWILLLGILLLLVAEVFLTRRMVQGGHTQFATEVE